MVVLVVSDALWALPVLRPVTDNRAGGWQGPAGVRVSGVRVPHGIIPHHSTFGIKAGYR